MHVCVFQSYWYVRFSKIFGEQLGIIVNKEFGCRSARLLREREQCLQKEKEIGEEFAKFHHHILNYEFDFGIQTQRMSWGRGKGHPGTGIDML